MQLNPYEVLQLNEKNATPSDIKKAYHNLLKIYHPDKCEDKNYQKFLHVVEAWKILSDQKSKMLVDCMQENSEAYVIYNEISIPEMEEFTIDDIFSYPCRCGSLFELSSNKHSPHPHDDIIIYCNDCSLVLKIKI